MAIELPNLINGVAPGFQAKVEQQAENQDPEVERLRGKNDLWKIYAPEWDLYLSAYEGGPDFANAENLEKYQRENPEDFADRCKRVHYLNYCAPLVDFFSNFIFTETIQRDGGANTAFYQDFITDVNKKGDDITTYMSMVSDAMQIFGMSFTLIDTPSVKGLDSGDVLTVLQEKELGVRPYWVHISPEEIIDWVVDEFEQLQYAKRVQCITKLVADGSKHFEKYTEWYLDKTVVTMVDVTNTKQPTVFSTETFDNPLEFIPIHLVRYKRSKRYPYMGNSFLRDFAYNNKEVMNLTSILQEFLYRQCFNVLVKQTDSAIPERDQQDGVLGMSNVLEYPKGADAPQYISPPSEPAEFIASERQRIISEMFKRAAQDTLNELFNGEKSSGFSQAQSFSKTVPFIATRADILEKAEMTFMKTTMKLINKEWDGKIKYKDRYELTNITDAISQLLQVFRDLMCPSETFVKEELKRLVHELDGKIPTDKMAKIMQEIESMDFPEWQGKQLEALIGAGKSPAEQQKPKSTGTMAEAASEAKSSNTSATKKQKGPQK